MPCGISTHMRMYSQSLYPEGTDMQRKVQQLVHQQTELNENSPKAQVGPSNSEF